MYKNILIQKIVKYLSSKIVMANKEKVMSIFGDMKKWILKHKFISLFLFLYVLFAEGSVVVNLLSVLFVVVIISFIWKFVKLAVKGRAIPSNPKKCKWCKKEFTRVSANYDFDERPLVCEAEACQDKEDREQAVQHHIEKMKASEHRLSIKQEAEKRLYGKVKTKKKRVPLSKELRDKVFRKFDNQCMICEQKQGLHIHHKDHDPKNNAMKNLLLLCGVCHKKIHMKVR